jgi:hypothetical protein
MVMSCPEMVHMSVPVQVPVPLEVTLVEVEVHETPVIESEPVQPLPEIVSLNVPSLSKMMSVVRLVPPAVTV